MKTENIKLPNHYSDFIIAMSIYEKRPLSMIRARPVSHTPVSSVATVRAATIHVVTARGPANVGARHNSLYDTCINYSSV